MEQGTRIDIQEASQFVLILWFGVGRLKKIVAKKMLPQSTLA
jgi:hypothetical protein